MFESEVYRKAADLNKGLTHEGPVSPEEVLGQRVEGNVGARTLSVVVGATQLGASGGEGTAAGDCQTGTDGGRSVHLKLSEGNVS